LSFIFLQENVETDKDEDHKFLTLCDAEQADDDEKRYTSDEVDDCNGESALHSYQMRLLRQ